MKKYDIVVVHERLRLLHPIYTFINFISSISFSMFIMISIDFMLYTLVMVALSSGILVAFFSDRKFTVPPWVISGIACHSVGKPQGVVSLQRAAVPVGATTSPLSRSDRDETQDRIHGIGGISW